MPDIFVSLFQLCVQKLRILIEDSDQNCECHSETRTYTIHGLRKDDQ